MIYASQHVANSILARSFAEWNRFQDSPRPRSARMRPLTSRGLQSMIYILACDQQRKTGQRLLYGDFTVGDSGPILIGLDDYYAPLHADECIRQYRKEPTGRSFGVDENRNPAFREALDRLWTLTEPLTSLGLARAVSTPDSAWARARREGRSFLRPEDLEADTSYLTSVGT